MQNKFSGERVLSIMESLGGIQSAVAPDFFYTRLRARMEQPVKERKTILVLRQAFVTTVLAVLLVVNVISLLQAGNVSHSAVAPEQQPAVANNRPATIESFAAAYNINTGSVYE